MYLDTLQKCKTCLNSIYKQDQSKTEIGIHKESSIIETTFVTSYEKYLSNPES